LNDCFNDSIHQEASIFFDSIIDCISKDLHEISQGSLQLTLPQIPLSFLKPFLEEMKKQIESEATLLELDGSFVIVGDLHGHFLDLCRIFKTFKYPKAIKYVFLGDIVDRGEFSFETIFFIFLLKYFYPDSVYLIRGNHEISSVCSAYGFLKEIETLYPKENVFDLFIKIFNVLPLAALLQQNILCVHGGICPEIVSVDQIKSIKRPLLPCHNNILDGLTWSDPERLLFNFTPNHRGKGYLFGNSQIQEFKEKNSLKMIVRGHQCVSDGIKFQFENSLATVFSASNYRGEHLNNSGVLMIRANGETKEQIFCSLAYLKRSDVKFNDNILPNRLMSKVIPKCSIVSPKKGLITSKKLANDLKQKRHDIQKNCFMNFYSLNI
jgi:protein phosphatase